MCEQKEEGITMDFFESVYHGEPPWDIGPSERIYTARTGGRNRWIGTRCRMRHRGECPLFSRTRSRSVGNRFCPYCNPESTGESRTASSNGKVSRVERVRAAHTGENVRYRHRLRAVPLVEP